MQVFSYSSGILKILDQRRLPFSKEYLLCRDYAQTIAAIRGMAVRGAPAISIAGAYALAQADGQGRDAGEAAGEIRSCRPTAVDLSNALGFMLEGMVKGGNAESLAGEWEASVYEKCRRLTLHGSGLVGKGSRVLTHCNTGPAAVGKHGTALGALIRAHREGRGPFVWVDETRPRFQGALTSWELLEEDIPHRVVTDSTAGFLMQKGEVDMVMVGADRICKNGDFANKIGTYSLAALAHVHKIPFYVLAPSSTRDASMESGEHIPIEQRDEREVLEPFGEKVFSPRTRAKNYAFDVTPSKYVTAYVTEDGVSENAPG